MNYQKELTPFLKTLARESGNVIKKYYRQNDLNVERKKDASPVTAADKGAEEVLRKLIEKEFPEHGILGEEFGEVRSDAEYKWVIDPIDGTKSFIAGTPLFGTLIALVKGDDAMLGCIHQPILNDLTIGDNMETRINGEKVRLRECSSVSEAVIVTTDIRDIMNIHSEEKFLNVMNECRYLRTWGDAYGYYLLASGHADVMLDPVMNAWDIMAVAPIIRGAGGVITDWHGKKAETGKSIIAANETLHQILISRFN